jgi:hypothetical protein
MDWVIKALHQLPKAAPSQPLVQARTRINPSTRFDFSRFAGMCHRPLRRISSQSIVIAGDRVYVNGKRPKFSKPLQEGEKLGLRDGYILHDEIIGARPGQTVKSNRGKPYRVEIPDLDTYIASMPRKVTPV